MGKVGEILSHPQELLPLVRIYLAHKRATKLPTDPGLAFCYGVLNNVSRSFAVVIQQLPNPLRDAICVFYLVLRGLDTVEDDMALDNKIKLPALLSFHEKIYERGFTMDCGYKHYKELMQKFDTVIDVFLALDPKFQAVIADITKRMGAGMAKFITKDVVSVKEYDEYCHYVAGLVGVGLSQLFASSGLEDEAFAAKTDLANDMGLFLQKTNIIRDYLEDILEEPAPRMFWPKDIWGKHAKALEEFKEPRKREAAVRCLNELVLDAMRHLPQCVRYMEELKDPNVFRFCAIPQIMAAGTLALCYNNGRVFEGVVKMRRGQTAAVFNSCSNMGDLYNWFLMFMKQTLDKTTKASLDDPTLIQMRVTLKVLIKGCTAGLEKWKAEQPPVFSWSGCGLDLAAVLVCGAYVYLALELGQGMDSVPAVLQPVLKPMHDVLSWNKAELGLARTMLAVVMLMLVMRNAIMNPR